MFLLSVLGIYSYIKLISNHFIENKYIQSLKKTLARMTKNNNNKGKTVERQVKK